MFNGLRFSLCASVSLVSLAVTGAVMAQEQAAQSVQGLEELTVTARRVEENIQRVPVAITAFSPEKLEQQDIKDFTSLTRVIPGVQVVGTPGSINFTFVRGISGAPTYFGDVPVSSNGFANFFDVANVQVLKGPQGTLFGLASNGGAFVYQPKKPGDTFGGNFAVTGGNYGRRSIEGALDIPVVEDRVLLRLAAQSYYREGYITDITSNRDLGNQNYYILRPSLTLRITDDIENTTLFQYVKSKSNPLPIGVLTDFNFSPTSQLPLLGTQALFNGGDRAAFDALRDQALATQFRLGPYRVNGYSAGCATPLGPSNGPSSITNLDYARAACPYTWSRELLLINTTTWNFSENFSLKNIFGYSASKSFSQPASISGSPLLVFDTGSPKNSLAGGTVPSWSEELQLQGKLFDDRVDFVLGTFHNATIRNVTGSRAPVGFPLSYSLAFGNFESATAPKSSTRNRSIYGQGNVKLDELLEGLTFTAGYRYSWDTAKSQTVTYDPATLVPIAVTGGPNSPAGYAKFSSGSYTFQLQYQVTPDIMLFVNNSKGYSEGGLQNVVGFEQFQPDSLNNLEFGVKSTFYLGDMQARLNASYYYGWYSNVKVNVTSTATNSATGVTNLVVVTQNAATARIEGIDADLTVVPVEGLEIGGFMAYANDRYTRYPSLNPLTLQPIDLSSTPFLYIPKYKWGIRGTYHLPIDQSIGDISLTANYSHAGQYFNTARPVTPTDPTNPNTGIVCTRDRTAANGYGPLSADGGKSYIVCSPAQENLDLSVDWRDVLGHEGLSASFSVTNVTKNVETDQQCGCDSALGVTARVPAVPRMFVVRLGYQF